MYSITLYYIIFVYTELDNVCNSHKDFCNTRMFDLIPKEVQVWTTDIWIHLEYQTLVISPNRLGMIENDEWIHHPNRDTRSKIYQQ